MPAESMAADLDSSSAPWVTGSEEEEPLAPELQKIQSILGSGAGSGGNSFAPAVGAPVASAVEAQVAAVAVANSSSNDHGDGNSSLAVSIRLLHILPKLFLLEKAYEVAQQSEDFQSCARLRDAIHPLKQKLKEMPVCCKCYIPYPSPAARGPEVWSGSWKRRNLTCNFCSVWPGHGLIYRAVRELQDAEKLIIDSRLGKASELRRLQQAVRQRKLKLKPGQGKALKWHGKSREANTFVGQFTRTMLRVVVEPGMQEYMDPLGQALNLLQAM